MATTLEAMARALFRGWFVDFDTRAKMAGAELPRRDLQALFPDRLNDEGKPEGGRFRQSATRCALWADRPSTKDPEFWDGGINWATPKKTCPASWHRCC